MTKNNALDVMEYVDAGLIEEADTYGRKKKKTVRAGWIAAVCLCLILAGAWGILRRPVNQGPPDGPDTPDVPDLPVESGIVIPAAELPDMPAGAIGDMVGLVVYDGGIYKAVQNYCGAEAEKIRSLVGEYLGHATGSIDEHSGKAVYAEEFASTVEGDVYTVSGYDTDFRICVCTENEREVGKTETWICFLERLNDITLTNGADLFENRLRLGGRISGIRWKSHGDWNQNAGYWQDAELDPVLWDEFLSQVDAGTFVSTWDMDTTYDKGIYSTPKQAHLRLTMEDGTVVSLRLIDGGYVGYDGLANCFVLIPGDAFDAVFNACGGNG